MDLLTANDRPGEYPPSYYAAVNDLPEPRLAFEASAITDIAIVGAGYTGLSAALHLARRGYRVTVLEAQRVGFGASGRNGGQVGTGQRRDQDWIERKAGSEAARHLWQMGLDAVSLVRSLAAEAGVPVKDGILEAVYRPDRMPAAHIYADWLGTEYGYEKTETFYRTDLRDLIDSPVYEGGVLDHGGAHLDPLAYVLGLARLAEAAGVTIYENSRVTGLTDRTVRTSKATLTAEHIILACNGYLGDLAPYVADHVMPINNFIVATEPLPDPPIKRDIAVADDKFVVNYFRMQDDRLIFGGGESYGYRFPRDIARKVRGPLARVFPQLKTVKITHAWGGTLGITMTRMPHLMRVGPATLSLSGYSGHGVAMGTLAGQIAAETIAGQAERFDTLAAIPAPPFPGGTFFRSPLLVLAMLGYRLRDML
ncbi:NAD(P)/FAD-dependent oxidoreductase [Aestuariibius sp. 2305UL40-4]|uniref:NAD(P)/FAD-dependent oxidoreductase n=1 Tax=Aestuariibius violaceus TaxID=3234132 RepID=UPI00345E7CDA